MLEARKAGWKRLERDCGSPTSKILAPSRLPGSLIMAHTLVPSPAAGSFRASRPDGFLDS